MNIRNPKRPAKPDPTTAAKEWAPIDPATIAPTVSKAGVTYPDGYNHTFSRNVSQEEAIARRWRYYQDGSTCRVGHISTRPVSNPHACTDCHRVKRGLPPIGAKAAHQTFYKERRPPAAPAGPALIVAPPAEPTVDQRDKAFLAAYAEYRDLAHAAADVGSTAAAIEARRSHSRPLNDAMVALEERLGIKKPLPPPGTFEWTAEKEQQLCTLYVDTGELTVARDSIGCTPSQYYRHLAESSEFARMVAQATPLAQKSLLERATSLGLAGNDRLLQNLLKTNSEQDARNPMEKMSLEELRTECTKQIKHFLKEHGYKIVPVNAVVIDGTTREPIDGT